MKKSLFCFLIGAFVLAMTGCEKESILDNSNGKVELYLIDSFSTVPNSAQIDESTVVISNSPLINYADFLSYHASEHIFELSESAAEKVKNLEHSVNGLAFAVKAKDVLIYTGYFWPAYSSASCDWVVIDPLMAGFGNRIQVKLGYPGLVDGQVIQDKRNDERILSIFKRDGKLK